MSSATFDRSGELVVHGHDVKGRPDTVEFLARAGEPTIDWLAEAFVWVDRWGTRAGIATLLEADGDVWVARASALPYDALQLVRASEIRLVFSQWVRMQPGQRFRLFLAGAVVCRPVVRIVALVKPPEAWQSVRQGFKRVRRS